MTNFVTLFTREATVPPTPEQLAAAEKLLGCTLERVERDDEPPYNYEVDPEYGVWWFKASKPGEPGQTLSDEYAGVHARYEDVDSDD